MRLLPLAAVGVALAAGALWFRFGWAPGHLASQRQLAAQYAQLASERALARDYAGAVPLYRRAVELEPGNLNAWLGLAAARADAHDAAGAMAVLEEAKQAARPDRTRRAELDRLAASIDLRFQRFDAARVAAERALAAAPEDPEALALLGLARAETLAGPADEAAVKELLRRAKAAGYTGPAADYAGGLVALHRGDLGQAIEAFRAAVERDPHSPSMRYRLATAYRLAGQTEAASRQLAEFERLRDQLRGGPE
jgi:tetratricopeptide (TPR) repeat protein